MSKKTLINPLLVSLPESPTLAVNQTVKRLREAGKPVYALGFGQAPFPIPIELTTAMSSYIDERSYLPSGGLPALQEAIAERRRRKKNGPITPGHVLMGPGSKLMLYLLLYTLDGPLILQDPCWVSYEPQARLLNKEVHTLPTSYENNYKIQPEQLEELAKKLTGKQLTLILNSPNNPTGLVYSEAELFELTRVFRKYNIIVIWDEIYGGITFGEKPFCSLPALYPEGSILTSGLSKLFSAGGYRLGYAIIPEEKPELVQPLVALISETFSCVNSPLQYATNDLYRSEMLGEFIDNTRKIHEAAGMFLQQRFVELGLRCHEPEGAFYLFPDFSPFREALKSKGLGDSRTLGRHLLDTYGVAMLPGEDFLHPGDNLAFRVATPDYDGAVAVGLIERGASVTDVEIECFDSLRNACEAIGQFLESL